jgi:hypothetical protein
VSAIACDETAFAKAHQEQGTEERFKNDENGFHGFLESVPPTRRATDELRISERIAIDERMAKGRDLVVPATDERSERMA